VALRDIEEDEIITEYCGEVRITSEGGDYFANILMKGTVSPFLRELEGKLVIDASRMGNEAMFINSVTRETPNNIVKNASMHTLWCNEELRILIYAEKAICKGESIVLDYNDHDSLYWEDEDARKGNAHQRKRKKKIGARSKI